MINVFALIATLSTLTAAALLFALLSVRRENEQLRTRVNNLWRAKLGSKSHLEAASDLLHHCRLLEQRNDWLEAHQRQFRNILAGAQLTKPHRPLAVLDPKEEWFAVREGQEMP